MAMKERRPIPANLKPHWTGRPELAAGKEILALQCTISIARRLADNGPWWTKLETAEQRARAEELLLYVWGNFWNTMKEKNRDGTSQAG